MSGYTLYTFFRSSTAWRARIALNLKQIPVSYKFIHLFKGQQRTQQYLKINPKGGVPALILPNGTPLVQSLAIIQYLNQIKKQPYDLYPGDPQNRALIRGFCEVINSGIHPYQNLMLLEHLHAQYKTNKEQWSIEWMTKGLNTIQKMIQKYNKTGKYVFGDRVTAADVVMYPQVVATNQRWGVSLDGYPHVKRILSNLKKIKQFTDAEPNNQPDRE